MMMNTNKRRGRAIASVLLILGVLVIPTRTAQAASGTITFDAASSPTASEDVGLFGNIGLSRDNTVDEVTVDYTITTVGDAVFDGDFALNGSSLTTGTVTFPAGQASASISVSINDDLNGEGVAGSESFNITLSSPVNVDVPGDLYGLGPTTAHTLTITDDGDVGSIVFSLPSSVVSEGDVAVNTNISVTRTLGTEGAAAATVSSTGGSATSGVDYTAVSALVGFAHGVSAPQIVAVEILGDNVPELQKDVVLSLTGPQAGVGLHTITINDDDFAGVISFDPAPVSGFESSGTVDVTFIRTGGSDGTISVDYSIGESGVGGFFATAVDDFTSHAGTVTFLQGEVSQTVSITLINDLSAEFDEAFQVDVVLPDLDFSGSNIKSVTIVDDELGAVFDSYTTPEDTALVSVVSVLANDSGPNGVDLDVVSFGAPTSGTLVSVDLETGMFTYQPALNFEGSAFFTYVVTDGITTDSGTVRVTVTDNNAAPDAMDDSFASVTRLEPTALMVLDNDVDQDVDPLTIITGEILSADGNGVDCSGGTSCVFTPADGYVGIDSFSYTVEDPSGATDAAVATVFVGLPHGCDLNVTPGIPLIGTNADEVLCGTPGNDIIDGGGGDDVLLGYGGNDILTGGDGRDRLVGGEGDDTINPGPGDNDDTLGGPGSDTVVYYANDPAADTVVVSETAISIVSTQGRDDGDLHETVENIIVELLAGNDSITVQAGETAAMDLRGGGGAFDRLQYDIAGLTGISDSGSIVTATGKQPVIYSGFEIRIIDTFVIQLTPGDDIRRFTASAASGLIIDPLGGNDDIQIDLGNLAGPVTVNDSGLPIEVDKLTVFGTPGGDQVVIRSVAVETASEVVNFTNFELLDVKGGAGDDTFYMEVGAGFAQAAFSTVVSVNGGLGTDVLTIVSASSCELNDSVISVEGIAQFEVVGVETLVTDCAGIHLTQSFSSGYWLVDASGRVTGFGLDHLGDHVSGGGTAQPVVGLADRPDKRGYWTVQSNGDVTPFGDAVDLGDLPSLDIVPAHPVVGMTATSSGAGYYLLGRDGGVFAFGDAAFFGSTGDIALDLPVAAMASSPIGSGYWFVAADGGIFAYGPGANFFGSVPQVVPYSQLLEDIVGIAPTASGNGYWLVAADGGIFAFGDAAFFGSVPGVLSLGASLAAPIVGMVATPSGNGYWIVAADGGVFNFGDADFLGSLGGTGVSSVVALAG